MQEAERERSDLILLNGFAPSNRGINPVSASDLGRNGITGPLGQFTTVIHSDVPVSVAWFRTGYVAIAKNECGIVFDKDFFFNGYNQAEAFYVRGLEFNSDAAKEIEIDPCLSPKDLYTIANPPVVDPSLFLVPQRPGYRDLVCRTIDGDMFASYRFHERSQYGPVIGIRESVLDESWVRTPNDSRFTIKVKDCVAFCLGLAIMRNQYFRDMQRLANQLN